MAFKIGFHAESNDTRTTAPDMPAPVQTVTPRPSVVQVYFPGRSMSLAYYNDRFDLRPGDLVYVDGKLEGQRGRVTGVNYNFRIKIADYKRVIAVADTEVHGEFFFAGSHFVTFDRAALPYEQAVLWFRAPLKADEEFVSGSDESSFPLSNLQQMPMLPKAAPQGLSYYADGRVRYLCINGERGRAIVEGSRTYEVEFTYRDGEISALTCSCFCGDGCKHEFAAMLQLEKVLEIIEKHHAEQFARNGCFAAVYKGTLFALALNGDSPKSFVL